MRLRLLALAAALVLAAAAPVFLASPYAPAVEPLRPIEEIWEIEDTHELSEVPLVTHLEKDGVPLAYDKESDTFYCALPLEAEVWPELRVTAPETQGIRMCFADDYLYDTPGDAMASGYGYRVLVWNEKEYAYTSIVFTGMPQICLTVDTEILKREDVPAWVCVNNGVQAVQANGRTHYRGGVTLHSPKRAYRIEYTKTSDGRKKIAQDTPGMGSVRNLILIPMIYDATLMRDRLSWDVYAKAIPENAPFGARALQHVELFVNDEYEGVYLMLEPYDYREELKAAGDHHGDMDFIYRVGSADENRPYVKGFYIPARGFEVFYSPPGEENYAMGLDAYMDAVTEEDDELFCRKALDCFDVDSMLRYLLLVQAGGWTDNVLNNLYVWADRTSGKTVYHFFPWDMDATWGDRANRIGEDFDYWMYFPTCDRMISLNAGGIMRDRLEEIWQELRSGPLTEEFVEECVTRYTHELNDSGAAARNSERWGYDRFSVDGQEIQTFVNMRFRLIDDTIRYFQRHEGEIEFLQYIDFYNKSKQIYFPDM